MIIATKNSKWHKYTLYSVKINYLTKYIQEIFTLKFTPSFSFIDMELMQKYVIASPLGILEH